MDSLPIDTAPHTSVAEHHTFRPRRQTQQSLPMQHTLRHAISAVGIGLHTGQSIRISLQPAPVGHGVVFQRTDLPQAAPLPARYDSVIDTRLSTVLGQQAHPENRIATVEHLMAALNGCGIDNVLVLVDGPEVPVFDGSSTDFVFLLDCAGRTQQTLARKMFEVLEPVRVEHGNAFVELLPSTSPGLSLSLSIEFSARAIGRQAYTLDLTPTSFRTELAASRTFTLREEIDALHQAGLARGGSLDNAVVVDGEHVLNPSGLRSPDEFIRHKMLDAVGDLYLAGGVLQARLRGHRSGHGLNNQLLRKLFARHSAWREVGSVAASAAAA